MRTENFDVTRFDGQLAGVAHERMVQAMNVVADQARDKCPVGTISRPMYKTGPYAGQQWTRRDAGSLRKTIRVVTRKTSPVNFAFAKLRSVRCYAGSRLRYYAPIVEFYTPFLRPAFNASKTRIKTILGVR